MRDGILIINKPQEWTSHDCVAVARRATGVKRAGHGGTLDPMAEGLLPIFIGKSTRIMEYLDADKKTYRCEARLGLVTDTQDIWGRTLEERSIEGITEEQVRTALMSFSGQTEQLPPKYSALKVNGRRLYEYARGGLDVDIEPRRIRIYRMEPEHIEMENGRVIFSVTCSKGTYVRTICHDLGRILGCGGTMSGLVRLRSGMFDLSKAISPEELKSMKREDIEELLLPVDYPLAGFGAVEMKRDRAGFFVKGNSIRWNQLKEKKKPDSDGDFKTGRGIPYADLYRVYSESGEFLGTGFKDREKNILKADKVLAAL